jgi:hypothetical protein
MCASPFTNRHRTQEKIVGIRTGPANLKYLHHVKELAMNVANNCDGRPDMDYIALLHKQLLGLCTYGFDHGLGQQLLLGEARYTLIEIYGRCQGSVYVPIGRMRGTGDD